MKFNCFYIAVTINCHALFGLLEKVERGTLQGPIKSGIELLLVLIVVSIVLHFVYYLWNTNPESDWDSPVAVKFFVCPVKN